jgi:general secretion pathway protein N
MKFLFRLLLLVIVLLLVLVLVAAFLPASAALSLFEGRTGSAKLEDVSGSVWNGRAGRVRIGERELGALSWQLSPWGLFARRADLDIQLDGRELKADGFVSLSGPGSFTARDLTLQMDAQRLQSALDVPALTFKGDVEFNLREVEVRSYFPARVDGTAVWRQARVGGSADAVFGDISAEFASRPDGGIAGVVHDSGGPLAIEGGQFAAGLEGFKAEATLRARDGDAAVQRALQYIGQPQADGSSRLEIRGELKRVGG